MPDIEKILADMDKLRERKAFVLWNALDLILEIINDYILPDTDYRNADLHALKIKISGHLIREILEHHDDDTNV